MKTIVFDVDGVLADFRLGFTKLANGMFGAKIETNFDYENWDVYPGMTKAQEKEVWNIVRRDWAFWYSLPPMVTLDTMAHINDLSDRHRVYFVTSRVGIDAKQQTERWLKDRGVVTPSVLITPSKGEAARILGATHAIDDKAGNAVAIQYMSSAESYIVDRPYNRFDHSVLGSKVKRIANVDQFIEEVA